jgi:NADH-quinone oxidoreductase subunit N
VIVAAAAKIAGPHIDWAGLSPLIAVLGGALLVLMLGLLRSRAIRERAVPALSVAMLAIAIGRSITQWGERHDLVAGALRLDELTLSLTFIFCVAGIAAVVLSWRHVAPREAAHGV